MKALVNMEKVAADELEQKQRTSVSKLFFVHRYLCVLNLSCLNNELIVNVSEQVVYLLLLQT